ncbi:unnamed protein product [Arabis nemorensis]|uniref:Uncharacterized protein n=1 Tax=Arabis nemorensis TaxID=586526 RepID=A0A565AWM1_9BRAS|nr:unnamed protein product [Arabis nemorensis]
MFLWRAVSGALAIADREGCRWTRTASYANKRMKPSLIFCFTVNWGYPAQQMMNLANIEVPTNGFSDVVEQNITHFH